MSQLHTFCAVEVLSQPSVRRRRSGSGENPAYRLGRIDRANPAISRQDRELPAVAHTEVEGARQEDEYFRQLSQWPIALLPSIVTADPRRVPCRGTRRSACRGIRPHVTNHPGLRTRIMGNDPRRCGTQGWRTRTSWPRGVWPAGRTAAVPPPGANPRVVRAGHAEQADRWGSRRERRVRRSAAAKNPALAGLRFDRGPR